MIKILSVFGTRPEAIKMAPVVRELSHHSDSIQSRICVTAQHREMLDEVLQLFRIRPDYDLDIMRVDQTLTEVTVKLLDQLEPVFAQEQPDWVLVQGDTTTAFAASLLAYYHRLRVGHIEAGLRTYDKYHPFPEEMNRRLIDIVADAHFVPTETARKHLLREGIPETTIHVTGNTVIDALLHVAEIPMPNGPCPSRSTLESSRGCSHCTPSRKFRSPPKANL